MQADCLPMQPGTHFLLARGISLAWRNIPLEKKEAGMAIKNKTKYAILGVLSLMAGSGYDIKKFCDKTIAHFWNENYGHIYPVLARLLKEKLIQMDDSGTDARRKVYRITQRGREVFCNWLMEPVKPQPQRSELLLKLSFGSNISKEKVIQMLEEVRQRYKSKLEQYRALEEPYLRDEKAQKQPEYPYWLASLRYGITSAEAAFKWSEETIESIKRHGEGQKDA